MDFIFNPNKNAQLKVLRGVSFEDVIYCILQDRILDIVQHPNRTKYPNQWIMIVNLDDYAYQVPFEYEGKYIRLITVFPSRKCTKFYLRGKRDDKT